MYIKKDKLDILVNMYKDYGYSNTQIKEVLKNKNYPYKRFDEIESCYSYFHAKMIELGYEEEQIRSLIIRYPKAMFYRFRCGRLKEFYVEYLENLKVEEKEEENIDFQYDKIKEILELINIPKIRIDYVFKQNYKLIYMNPKDVLKNIRFYLNCGLPKEKLTYYATKNPHILEYGKEYFKDLLTELKLFGVDESGFLKILLRYLKQNTFLYSKQLLEMLKVAKTKKLNFISFGKSLVKNLSVLDYTAEKFEDTYNDLIDIGFSEEETCNILSRAISVLSMNRTSLEYKISILQNYNVSREEALHIIGFWPKYFTLSAENIINKLDVAYRFNVLDFLLNNPSNFIQSAILTENRALYLRIYYPMLTDEKFARSVYQCEKKFLEKYNKTNDYTKYILQITK